ncbi:DUF4148 domain-containing protein [Pandoraea fibrosis]|uniref:DUF4148 domain-containing protein n=1 Tax=Pandoraea fibrosis TaxID=1891094 RepID=A0A5E4W0F3_9BURK|nr:DUF4148 domain-containing protein [Pandoraea fibrosis]QHE90452.1 DUF4148 domain-containing protein [Pandoraea fibrosis]QHF11284.1 DUF4148 domain-containing protein [Pandoraea fibrosis]VVE18357.1 hypothetical protein PFI31113_02976 [Pandoraea fibrosis]
MKRTLITSALISAMLAVSAGSAFASDAFEGPSEFSWVPQTSVLTRAQVREELVQAQQAGLLQQHDSVYPKSVAKVGGATAVVTPGSVGNIAQAGTTYFGS